MSITRSTAAQRLVHVRASEPLSEDRIGMHNDRTRVSRSLTQHAVCDRIPQGLDLTFANTNEVHVATHVTEA